MSAKADTYLKDLEIKYNNCADVYCANTGTCCNNDSYLQEIENFDFDARIDKEQKNFLPP